MAEMEIDIDPACHCCRKYARGILPSGVLICPRCDMTETGGVPNDEDRIKDVRRPRS